MKRGLICAALFALAGLALWVIRTIFFPSLPPKPRTVEQVVNTVGLSVDLRLRPSFWKAGVPYPPKHLALLAFKEEKRMDIYAAGIPGDFRFIRSCPILAASGVAGPKLREGDLQVPEGFYRIELLNPNSGFHLSLRVDYPNAEDIARARLENRDPATLGGDIMIHGNEVSAGCLAMGDPVSEEIFVLVAKTGLDQTRLLISPWDFRIRPAPDKPLYRRLAEELKKYPPAG